MFTVVIEYLSYYDISYITSDIDVSAIFILDNYITIEMNILETRQSQLRWYCTFLFKVKILFLIMVLIIVQD